jgi:hypothetical protein
MAMAKSADSQDTAGNGGGVPALAAAVRSRVADAVELLSGGDAGPAVLFDFVFAPGHPDPRPENVFASWSELVAAANAVGGLPYVTFDDTHGPVVIPAGEWAFTSRPTFRADAGRAALGPVQVEIADGARISGVRVFRDVSLVSVSSAPVLTSPPGDNPVYVIEGSAMVQASGSGPFIEHGTPQPCLLIVSDNASALNGSAPVLRVSVPGDGAIHVFTWGSGFVDQKTISGVAGRTYGARISQSDGFIDPAQDVPAFPIAFGALGQSIQHVPKTPTNWAGSPASVHAAIERLAAALVARTGGAPIP